MQGFLSPLMIVVLAAPGLLATERYEVQVLAADVTESSLPPAIAADFDADGHLDHVLLERNPGKITIDYGSGRAFVYEFGERLHDLDVTVHSFSREGKFPSLVVAHLGFPWREGARDQIVLRNRQGHMEVIQTPIHLYGRSVTCHRVEERSTCFYSSYRGRSQLVSFDSSGNGQNVTASSGLPFQQAYLSFHTNGYFMMGATFIDLDHDGKKDLVGAGQHSDILVAMARDAASTSFDAIHYQDPTGEYMRVTSLEFDGLDAPPCVYYSMEEGESAHPDFIQCYDLEISRWYNVEIPGRGSWSNYEKIRRFDYDGDGRVDFAGRDAAGQWNVFTLAREAFAIGANAIEVAHTGYCLAAGEMGISQEPCRNAATQSWQVSGSSACLKVVSQDGRCLSVPAEGAAVWPLVTCRSTGKQCWRKLPGSMGSSLRSVYTGQCLGFYHETPKRGSLAHAVTCGNLNSDAPEKPEHSQASFSQELIFR